MKETDEIRVTRLEDGDYIVGVDGKALIKSDMKTCMRVLNNYLMESDDNDRD